jgi:hypothetical protein
MVAMDRQCSKPFPGSSLHSRECAPVAGEEDCPERLVIKAAGSCPGKGAIDCPIKGRKESVRVKDKGKVFP